MLLYNEQLDGLDLSTFVIAVKTQTNVQTFASSRFQTWFPFSQATMAMD